MMGSFNRASYLALPEVQGFITYLSSVIKNRNGFSHQYINRRSKKNYTFNSQDHALNQYSWPEGKNSFKETERTLEDLQSQLRFSLKQRDEKMTLAACLYSNGVACSP